MKRVIKADSGSTTLKSQYLDPEDYNEKRRISKMKRMIKAKVDTNTAAASDVRVAMVDFLLEEGSNEHDILRHFFEYLPSSEVVEVLEDYIHDCDLTEEWEEYIR